MIFDEQVHSELATLFQPAREYAGYRPAVREAPNGDGRVDTDKRYLHVALKYDPPEWARKYLARAHWEACRVAEALGVPDAFYPRVENSTLRVLEYPVGAGSAEHKDFNLFTILCWRSTPDDLERLGGARLSIDSPETETSVRLDKYSPGLHIGELGELVGLGPATPHRVPARSYVQKSIVYFALPANGARVEVPCPDCPPDADCTRVVPVRDWLAERLSRSRVYT